MDGSSAINTHGMRVSIPSGGTELTAMTTISTEAPQFLAAIQACALALRRMADYELDPSLPRRTHALGERNEFLSPAEHEELLALVDFAHQRTREKLEAQAALTRLRGALPGMLSDP